MALSISIYTSETFLENPQVVTIITKSLGTKVDEDFSSDATWYLSVFFQTKTVSAFTVTYESNRNRCFRRCPQQKTPLNTWRCLLNCPHPWLFLFGNGLEQNNIISFLVWSYTVVYVFLTFSKNEFLLHHLTWGACTYQSSWSVRLLTQPHLNLILFCKFVKVRVMGCTTPSSWWQRDTMVQIKKATW